jgi:glycosyltransferase involved in cell wall biosynthesis
MKFLHLSTGDDRGAFTGAYRLHRNLISSGHESYLLVADKRTTDPTVLAPDSRTQRFRRFTVKVLNQLLKLACGVENRNKYSMTLNAALVSSRWLKTVMPAGYKPDLIVVHFVADFLSARQLDEVSEHYKAPMAFYLMDMGMLTGGCHYAWTCEGYLANCSNCPATSSGVLKRWIASTWNGRARRFAKISPTVVAGSGWLLRQAHQSRLCDGLEKRTILIGIESDTYKPENKAQIREAFGLPTEKTVLYFGAQNLDDPRKGFASLSTALRMLQDALTPDERAGVCLFTVGQMSPSDVDRLDFLHIHQSYISDPALFPKTYAASDLFICPSLEDSGPMMINESIVSGTPVAAFEMGVAMDLVVPGGTGYRVPLGDSAALAAALVSYVRLPGPDRQRMSTACRALGLERCSTRQQVRHFVELARSAGNVQTGDPQ